MIPDFTSRKWCRFDSPEDTLITGPRIRSGSISVTSDIKSRILFASSQTSLAFTQASSVVDQKAKSIPGISAG
jgi:hypothetical protein